VIWLFLRAPLIPGFFDDRLSRIPYKGRARLEKWSINPMSWMSGENDIL
jgi:hypothetical protein